MKTLISWLLTCTIILSLFTLDQVSCRCSLSDQSSLIKLNSSVSLQYYLSFSDKPKLMSWNASSDCCIWEGVSCDQDGHVTHLDLSSYWRINGTFNNSNSVFHLQHLKTLYMDPYESFTIQNLTMFLQNFPQLEELKLNGPDLSASGKDWCQVLSSSVPKLKVLSLISCRLSGPLDHSLLRLQSLSIIDLSFNKFNCPIPKFFTNFSNLISLDLSYSSLQGTVPREIFQIPTLQSIHLSSNEFLHVTLPEFPINNSIQSIDLSGTKLSELPGSVGNLWNLSSLDLSYCQLYGALPRSIENLTQLEYLSLSGNKFTGPIPSSLFALPSLKNVYLSYNQFTSFEVTSPSNLSSIYLSENSLNGEISSHQFKGLTKLTYLSLSSNSLNGSIPSSLFTLPSLERVDLSNNQFISFEVTSPSNLSSIDLSSNFLNGSIPSSLFALPSLKSLDLSNNQFKYCETAKSSIFNILYLSHNNLADLGSLLTSIIRLENLASLDLSFNKFNGTIQLNIFQGFNRLEYLDLSYNKLSVNVSNYSLESFPQLSQLHLASCNLIEFPHLKNQSNLLSLDVSNNRISGEIPNWIWELKGDFVTSLNLSHNNLSGEISFPYFFHHSLFSIDLNSNRLQGEISFSQFPIYADFSSNNFSSVHIHNVSNNREFFNYLSFSNNNITGDIPKSICVSGDDISSVLDLSHNKLSGRIPTCIAEEIKLLSVLNLRENNLIGPIPDAFPRDCSLQIIDLNGNFIDGEIPKSLANCTQLRVLDLGHNNMTGEFPCFLKNISTLQVLILRANNLHGSIECLDSDGSWPMLQILDIAQNRFSGELGVKWLENLQVIKNDTLGLQSNVLQIRHPHLFINQEMAHIKPSYDYIVTTVTLKGQEREFPKILAILAIIDLSSNNFSGSIPEEFGQLRALKTLNLSNNALTGEIPSSLGDLKELETLDLSHNSLNGTIPASLGGLNFLQFMNLSFNQLTGKIPEGSQIQTFSEDSFIGNEGLCGFPLKKNCSDHKESPNPKEERFHENSKIDWSFLSAEIGFIVGFGVVFAPIVFLRRWRILYFDRIDDIVAVIFPLAVARKWFQWTNTY